MEVAADCGTLLAPGMAGCYTQVFALHSDLIRQVADFIRQVSLCNACVQYTKSSLVTPAGSGAYIYTVGHHKKWDWWIQSHINLLCSETRHHMSTCTHALCARGWPWYCMALCYTTGVRTLITTPCWTNPPHDSHEHFTNSHKYQWSKYYLHYITLHYIYKLPITWPSSWNNDLVKAEELKGDMGNIF